MRTTVDIPKNLIDEAMALGRAKTKSQLLTLALKDYLSREKRKRLLSYKGKVDFDIDLDSLRQRSDARNFDR
jgi:Arc/MetJ family transcription regulator